MYYEPVDLCLKLQNNVFDLITFNYNIFIKKYDDETSIIGYERLFETKFQNKKPLWVGFTVAPSNIYKDLMIPSFEVVYEDGQHKSVDLISYFEWYEKLKNDYLIV